MESAKREGAKDWILTWTECWVCNCSDTRDPWNSPSPPLRSYKCVYAWASFFLCSFQQLLQILRHCSLHISFVFFLRCSVIHLPYTCLWVAQHHFSGCHDATFETSRSGIRNQVSECWLLWLNGRKGQHLVAAHAESAYSCNDPLRDVRFQPVC